MKGKVLGFDPASGTGAINGDDGKRYRFTATDNKGPAPLKANDTVDFEAVEDSAKEIYLVKTGFSIATSASTNGTNYVQMILSRPHAIWAAVIIFGSLIAGYFGSLGALSHMSGPFGSGFGISAIFIALLFGIPVIAGVLIFLEFANKQKAFQFRLITAAAAIGGPILLPTIAGLFAPEGLKGLRELGDAFGGSGHMGVLDFIGFNISLGMVITVTGGVLIILTNMGIVKLPKS